MTPKINVGIVEAEHITIELNGPFSLNGLPPKTGTIEFEFAGNDVRTGAYTASQMHLQPLSSDATFTIRDVSIGIGFHWQQKENQTFAGSLRLVADNGQLLAINEIDIESYLLSVISSEMNASAPGEFLKAHAVISRSWALAQLEDHNHTELFKCLESAEETVKWYDHSAHELFDVCADDHCQRYQGLTRRPTQQASEAIEATRGEILTFNGCLCDARFSKCCGGITEQFSTCWQPTDPPYLQAVRDNAEDSAADVSSEFAASEWISTHPDAFCANPSEKVLSMVLNNYDRSTPHLYRWTVGYTAHELADIIRERSGLDFGKIISLKPLHRGPSGRIDRLRIEGTKHTRIIGKELEIRRTLSRTHLYSSAFIVRPHNPDSNNIPTTWELHGAGWGHGVGLCQIGAAVMATRGYSYREILAHYFRGAKLTKFYQQ